MCVCGAAGWGWEQRRHLPALGGDGRKKKTLVGTGGAVPSPAPFPATPCPGPRPREAEGPCALERQGAARFSSPGEEDAGARAEDRPWHQPRCLHRGCGASPRSHPRFCAQRPRPGPLPARRQIRPPRWPERVLGGVFKAAVPALPPPRPRGVAAAPPTSPGARRPGVRGARSRCGRAPRMPLPGPRW